ncbi:protein DEHYDRATION-INDUCED 19 homolog 4-like isoform X2 [Vitis riparia]|uniref:protein DEHYDRATION-INDUCED 19 homolog 4-like isoform X2 n=1 Tax=Vitis riparia TaxID=96939 RepID=UPI00155A1B18|nr:protein DEHYDRATION-INDUCED 19 homolog 4-like isoform X2 [Vitis riparia]
MNTDFWASRLAAAKRQYALQHHHNSSQLDRLSIDDFEVEDEARPDFPCPYCYEDYDIASLCSHLEDEHSCESRVTVCPICSVKVARDMLSHITLQHGHLFKLQRRRRLRRVAIPSSQALSLLGRDLREAHLQVLLATEAEEISKSVSSSAEDTSTMKAVSAHAWKSSFDPSLSYEERERRMRQAAGRAGFVQDILLSTLLAD